MIDTPGESLYVPQVWALPTQASVIHPNQHSNPGIHVEDICPTYSKGGSSLLSPNVWALFQTSQGCGENLVSKHIANSSLVYCYLH